MSAIEQRRQITSPEYACGKGIGGRDHGRVMISLVIATVLYFSIYFLQMLHWLKSKKMIFKHPYHTYIL